MTAAEDPVFEARPTDILRFLWAVRSGCSTSLPAKSSLDEAGLRIIMIFRGIAGGMRGQSTNVPAESGT